MPGGRVIIVIDREKTKASGEILKNVGVHVIHISETFWKC
jgi:hypothetical protein